MTCARISTTEVTEFFIERSLRASREEFEARKAHVEQTAANEEDDNNDDDKENDFMALEENPRLLGKLPFSVSKYI